MNPYNDPLKITKQKPQQGPLSQGPSVSVSQSGITPQDPNWASQPQQSAPPPSPAPAPSPGSVAPQGGLNQQMQGAISNLITQGQQAPSLDAPHLRAQSDAFSVQRQRAAERQRNALAERHAGGGSGALDVGINRIEAQRGFDQGQFDAGLLGSDADRRQAGLLAALGLGGQGLDRDLRREGLDLNRQLGFGDLDLRNRGLSLQGELGRGSLDLDRLRTALQDEQFYAGLGLDAGKYQAYLNQLAMSQLLGAF
jgi:hypothetical protein